MTKIDEVSYFIVNDKEERRQARVTSKIRCTILDAEPIRLQRSTRQEVSGEGVQTSLPKETYLENERKRELVISNNPNYIYNK